MRRIFMILLAVGLSTIGMTAQKSAMEVVNAMSPGWNLGNTFEASSGQGALFNNKAGLNAETSWQGTKTTPELIEFVKAQGFRSVRIPCAWVLGHISDATQYTIDKDWMARVKEVVDYCIKADLYVVLLNLRTKLPKGIFVHFRIGETTVTGKSATAHTLRQEHIPRAELG